jgi:hypothetical protein
MLSEWQADQALGAEAVDRGAEGLIEVEARRERGLPVELGDVRAVHHALHDVGRAQAPDAAGHLDVVGPMHLALVVPAAGAAREEGALGASPELEIEPAFGDVEARRAVLAHGAELDEVAIGNGVAHGEEGDEGAHHVVGLGVHGRLHIAHAVGRGGHLAQVDDRLGPKRPVRIEHERRIREVTLVEAQVLSQSLAIRV